MGAFDLIRKGVQGVKSAPFFSKVDEVLDSLPRNKGTGDEFLREIEKAKGVKPAEIQDRGIAKALKGKPKMTKAEVQKIFESNPPPRVQEKVLSSDVPDYDEWLENKAQEVYGVDWFDLYSDEQKALEKMYGELPLTQYDRFKTPGGENYREILLKLPAFDDKRLMELEADIRRSSTAYTNPEKIPYIKEKMDELARLKEEKAAAGAPYISSHYRTDPNLLAHIRVQDFTTPEGKKVLLVDEIQSDWHQEGRKKGYRGDQKKIDWNDPAYVQARERAAELGNEFNMNNANPARQAEIEPMLREARMAERAFTDHNNRIGSLIPDAPFKKNWHELAMKRVLDYAAENGYDTVAITPGAEQAKRYDLSKHLNEINYGRNPDGTFSLTAVDKNGRPALNEASLSESQLESMVGKDLAQKIVAGEGNDFPVGSVSEGKKSLSGIDLEVGGEGMKGFYDKILPDYLNNFGKQYGSSVGEIELQKPITRAWSIEDLFRDTGITPDQWQKMSSPERQALRDKHFADFSNREEFENYGTFHSFDITPQLREEVKNKGLPLYSKMGMGPEGLAAGSGAATIGSQMFDENNEQQVQNPVHFTENPDAMLLELMQRN
jgi:hypothetical protein